MLIIIILHIAVALTPPCYSCQSTRSVPWTIHDFPTGTRRCELFRLEHIARSVMSKADQDAEGQCICQESTDAFQFIDFGSKLEHVDLSMLNTCLRHRCVRERLQLCPVEIPSSTSMLRSIARQEKSRTRPSC